MLEHTARELGLDIALPSRGEFWTVRASDRPFLGDVFETVRRATSGEGDVPSKPEASAMCDAVAVSCARSVAVDNARRPHIPTARFRSVAIARRCEEYAVDARYQGVTMVDLCRAAGRSDRRVRQAFYDCYGMSPVAYLRIAALHATRAALLEGPVTTRDVVSRTASDFGFWHLSRFAGQYRALFGESPSSTIEHRRDEARSTMRAAATRS
jgi:AraC-like DNA-binding protein